MKAVEAKCKILKRKQTKANLIQLKLFIFCKPACLQEYFHGRVLFIQVFSSDGHYGLIVRQVYFAGCRLQVLGLGLNLIITGKPLALKIINNLSTHQGFLHKVVYPFHTVKTRSICHEYLLIDVLRPVKSLQSHLDGRSTDVSIDSRFGWGLPSTTEDCHHK